MAETFKLKILVPAGEIVSEEVSSVYLPTEDGQIGILPEHVSYTALLGTGILEYRANEQAQPNRLVVSGGFVTFEQTTGLTVLADSVDLVETIDSTNYAKERPELEKFVGEADGNTPQWSQSRAKLERIRAIDQLVAN